MKDYYLILQILPDASEKEIKDAFRKLAKAYHPDRNPGSQKASERFMDVREAYEILNDPASRDRYNIELLSHSDRYELVREEEKEEDPWEEGLYEGAYYDPQAPAPKEKASDPELRDLGPEWTPFIWLLWIVLPFVFGGVASLLSTEPWVWLGAAAASLLVALWLTIEVRMRH